MNIEISLVFTKINIYSQLTVKFEVSKDILLEKIQVFELNPHRQVQTLDVLSIFFSQEHNVEQV